MSSKSKARLPAEPLISIRIAFLRPVANRVASKTPRPPPVNRAMKTAASSTVTGPRSVPAEPERPAWLGRDRPFLHERLELAGDLGDLFAGDVLGQVDDVGADVAERTGARLGLVQPPGQRRLGIGDPVLEVLRPHVPDLADPALGDEPAGQRDRRHPSVGEADHRAYAVLRSPLGGRDHRLGLGDGVGQRLLAEHVLARLERGDRDLGVRVPRRADVDEVDVRRSTRRRQSVSVSSQPSRPAASAVRSASRPHTTCMVGLSGRSKKCGAVRQAWEWAAPMKA